MPIILWGCLFEGVIIPHHSLVKLQPHEKVINWQHFFMLLPLMIVFAVQDQATSWELEAIEFTPDTSGPFHIFNPIACQVLKIPGYFFNLPIPPFQLQKLVDCLLGKSLPDLRGWISTDDGIRRHILHHS